MGAPEASVHVSAGTEAVWAVLSDGWLYPLWVVGATHMRDVDDDWPARGSQLHHSVGVWPFLLSDTTRVLDVEPGRRLVLQARAWPAGTVRVELTLEPRTDGCLVRMAEEVASGPGWFLPNAVQAPVVRARNTEALTRLTDIAVHRRAR